MSTTYDEVKRFLEDKGLWYETRDDGSMLTLFEMKTYRNPSGKAELLIEIRLPYNGEYFEAFAPRMYVYKEGSNKTALLQLLASLREETPLIRFTYNYRSGDVAMGIEFPLDDAKLTSQQLFSVLYLIIEAAEVCHPMIQQAIDKGIIPLPERNGIADVLAGATQDEVREVLEEIRRRKNCGR